MNKLNVELNAVSSEIDKMLTEFLHTSFDVRQKAIQAGAEVFKSAVESATPIGETGKMAQSWKIKTEYPDHRYVGNTKTAKGKVYRKTKNGKRGEAREGVPLSNVLEYKENSPHYGFIRKCFDENEAKIYQAIKSKIKNGGN